MTQDEDVTPQPAGRTPDPHEDAVPARFDGVVALDGPSGTGKSTVARMLARRLGARYLDTGAMYRTATLAVLEAGLSPDDSDQVAAVVRAARIEVATDPAHHETRLNGRRVDRDIRAARV